MYLNLRPVSIRRMVSDKRLENLVFFHTQYVHFIIFIY